MFKTIMCICANSKIIMWIAIVGVILQLNLFIFVSGTSFYHALAWMIWLSIILSHRIYLNGNLKINEDYV